ncbi:MULTISPECIES: 4-oxalocrotonate tautomerase DmpI [unclassified Desulfovibrio]|uniref:4-oxalocrotonate tautomerase DmpI n=1 Tax=unclassified Desulfovibrio TaxID=2593640 RepID=UPI002FDA28CF
MPTITLEMAPMNVEQKRKIAEEFTESAARITGIDKEFFYVFIKENNLENVAVGGKLLSDKAHETQS